VSEKARLFAALELPEDVRAALHGWGAGVAAGEPVLRLLAPEALHVTLVFLGYRAERDVERLTEVCFAEPPGSFELEAREVRGVPPRRPRLHALDIADTGGALGRWQQQLSGRLAAAGLYEPERRPFWPHVTLARVKRPGPGATEPPPLADELRGSFTANRVTLYRSTLLPQGARYDALASHAAVS
jgi:2'-5' RNA ligase